MPTTVRKAVEMYLQARDPAHGTRRAYRTTVKKWLAFDGQVPLEKLDRPTLRKFLSWVHEQASASGGSNPGRTSNKARTHLRAVVSWAWENDLVDTPPRFPQPFPARDVAGRHYLTKAEINALYFATHQMPRPQGWRQSIPVGRYWRAALVVFFNYGLDSGTVWGTTPFHEPILWRNLCWERKAPSREVKQTSRWGWLTYRRVKTGKAFCRPMNRVVNAHLRSLCIGMPDPEAPVFVGSTARPNVRFRELCQLAGIGPKKDPETAEEKPWVLKDLRKTCATYYDEHLPESSIEILGHSVGGVTYRHYAHRAPLAHKAIMTLPQPSAFLSLVRGFDRQCPCCRRPFADVS
jgi:integrase